MNINAIGFGSADTLDMYSFGAKKRGHGHKGKKIEKQIRQGKKRANERKTKHQVETHLKETKEKFNNK